MGSKAFESPLISHARMRAMYRALVETRALSEHAPRSARFAKSLEACWVAAAIDLKPGDLTSADGPSALIEHAIQIGAREAARAATVADIRKTLRALDSNQEKFAGSPSDRLLCAAGQAMALRSAGGKGVVVAFVAQNELKPAEWKRLFTIAGANLPLIVVSLPVKTGSVDLQKAARLPDGKAAVPVVPVDAGDVVALYRVAQESIGRARAEGGLVVIECVAFGVDPVKLMRTQLIKKGICTEAWAAAVDAGFRRMVGTLSL